MPNYQQPNQVAQQVNVMQVRQGIVGEGQRGPGPYPGVQCCGCFEIKCGMKVLAVLALIGGIAQILGTIVSFVLIPRIGDGKFTTYLVILFLLALINLGNVYFQAKWLS